MPNGRRTSEPVRIGVATSRPNSVSLRLSSALILIPMTENITQTAKFTAKASVLAASAEICSRLYVTLRTAGAFTSTGDIFACTAGLLDERGRGSLEIDALDRRLSGQHLEILAQCRDE